MDYSDIQRFTRSASYTVDHQLGYLEQAIESYVQEDGLDLDPDFQRAHVWTEAQQIAFMEYLLRGGTSGRDIYTNCPGWQMGSRKGPYVLVDGKQRLTAVLRWLRSEDPYVRPPAAGIHGTPTTHPRHAPLARE